MASFPTYTMPDVSGPGLLYVNSILKDPKSVAPELFTEWYEDVHIRDIFKTSGIKAAFRYYTTTPDKVERPYLALYPLKDMAFLTSKEFKSIPVKNDVLPEGKHIFEFADFDTRYYLELKNRSNGGSKGT
jgi:hypothetical protein